MHVHPMVSMVTKKFNDKNKMATSPTSPTSFSSFASAVSVSKARLKRKSTKRDSSLNNTDGKLEKSETFPFAHDEVEMENRSAIINREPLTSTLKHDNHLEQGKHTRNIFEQSRTNPIEIPVSDETSNIVSDDPSLLTCISIKIDHASPLKAKLLGQSITVRVTFVDELTGLPVKKSSQEIPAVSYYETDQNIDFIMPVMTKAASIECNRKGHLVAKWCEEIVFHEVKDHLLNTRHVVMLIELMTLPTASIPPYPFVWGILIPSKLTLNEDNLLPIQLYKVPKRKQATAKPTDLLSISFPRKYPTIMYIRISVNDISTLPTEPTLRSRIPTLPEVSYKNTTLHNKFKGSIESVDGGGHCVQWSRLPGQSCAITDNAVGSIAGSTNGCSAIAFSPSGRMLASACMNNNDQGVINIYQIVSSVRDWVKMCSLDCSVGIVHECSWSHDETKLACASASGLCHVWTMSDHYNELLLAHPTYVYTLEWILDSTVLVTGCYDGVIRCWKRERLVQAILTGASRINTLCYDKSHSNIYSGTANGCINVWTINNSQEGDILNKDKQLDLPTIEGCSVQKLLLIPKQQRLIVHATNSPYHIVDLRLDSIVASFSPEQPVHHPSALCVTPCGSLLIANTDAHTHFWDINKGVLVKKIKIRGLNGPLSAIKYHPYDYLAVYAALGRYQKIVFMTK